MSTGSATFSHIPFKTESFTISIARAIMKDVPIVILDEETANVDPENEKELMEAVAELTHDKTVIRSISARFPHRQRLAPTKAGIAPKQQEPAP